MEPGSRLLLLLIEADNITVHAGGAPCKEDPVLEVCFDGHIYHGIATALLHCFVDCITYGVAAGDRENTEKAYKAVGSFNPAEICIASAVDRCCGCGPSTRH